MAPFTRSTARRGNPARDDFTFAPAASGPTTPFQVPDTPLMLWTALGNVMVKNRCNTRPICFDISTLSNGLAMQISGSTRGFKSNAVSIAATSQGISTNIWANYLRDRFVCGSDGRTTLELLEHP
ncbi:hypothetical protein L218DRAFT_949158 [Marasmius fiardii PR-910]|nr:hypothetical protein L218DRAFT_949158 [Marasmius fiardii PR-910]